jgi:hypothetical protein
VIFQFIMGSNYPLVTEVNTGKQKVQCELKKSYRGKTDFPVVLPIGDIMVTGYILYKIYPSENQESKIAFNREGDKLIAKLPLQPPAGKLEYKVLLEREGTTIPVNEGKAVIVRFIGKVPVYILILQSLAIFLAIFYSTLTGIYATFGIKTYRWLIYITITFLLGAVFLLQPLMHKYALNKWWTCFPNSLELGDNKLLIALIVWIVTACFNFKKARPLLVIFASIISILMFSVPHGFPGLVHEPITMEVVVRNIIPLLQLF